MSEFIECVFICTFSFVCVRDKLYVCTDEPTIYSFAPSPCIYMLHSRNGAIQKCILYMGTDTHTSKHINIIYVTCVVYEHYQFMANLTFSPRALSFYIFLRPSTLALLHTHPLVHRSKSHGANYVFVYLLRPLYFLRCFYIYANPMFNVFFAFALCFSIDRIRIA